MTEIHFALYGSNVIESAAQLEEIIKKINRSSNNDTDNYDVYVDDVDVINAMNDNTNQVTVSENFTEIDVIYDNNILINSLVKG